MNSYQGVHFQVDNFLIDVHHYIIQISRATVEVATGWGNSTEWGDWIPV